MSEVTPRFKQGRVRSRRHLDWVKTLPCSVPGCPNRTIDPHHLTCSPQPKGRGLRAGDNWVVPLCRIHHDAAYPEGVHHKGDERAWWEARCADPIRIAERLASISRAAGRLP